MSTKQSFNQVKEFHQAFNYPVAHTPQAIPVDIAVKRAIWTAEELVEFLHASVAGDPDEFEKVLTQLRHGITDAAEKSRAVGPIPKEHVIVAQMDALTDVSYFTDGSFVIAGVDPQPLFDIVQDANMAKLGADGKPILRESDGKIMKPEGWEPPEEKLELEIKRQMNTDNNE